MRPQFLNPKGVSLGTMLVFLALIVFIGPFLSIWALNTLFPSLVIPYTLETWLAMAVIHLLINSKVSNK